MANKHRGYVDIHIGGKDRQLRYSLNALAELQEELGLNDLNELLAVNLSSFRTLMAFLYWGLQEGTKGPSREELGDWQIDVAAAIEKVTQAFCLAIFGTPEPPTKKPKAPKAKAAPSTGPKRKPTPSAPSASGPAISGISPSTSSV